MDINKLDLWRAASILEQSLKSQGVAELRLGKDVVEFEVILQNTDKEDVGEHFRRSITILPPNRFLYLAAFDKKDKVIAIVAARLDDIEGWSLQRFVKELWERSYKTKSGMPVSMSPNTPAYAEDISGPVVYLGDGFVSEKWRGNGISAAMIRMLTLLAWDEWKPNIAYGWMRSHHALSGMHMKWGVEKHGKPPKELFIHGRTKFNDEEWHAFCDACPDETNLVYVRIIKTSGDTKLFRHGDYPVIRGTALILDERNAYFWSNGFLPRLDTYIGPETPNPLFVSLLRSSGEFPKLKNVLKDILGLTKINFNACNFNDGLPVTVRFADKVGDVLVMGSAQGSERQPFKFYI